MKSKVFNSLFLLFTLSGAFAQHQLSGYVMTGKNTPVAACPVQLNSLKVLTDDKGQFSFTNLKEGRYNLLVSLPDFKIFRQDILIGAKDTNVTVLLENYHKNLEEVVVRDQPHEFGFTRMRGVENMGIYEGKKTEVILPEKLTANLATNNARQVFSRVAGLNIYENDGAGLQLSIGGRGLDPNRTANFNVRQNGYDISADALGYPESYYTPPVEAIGRIQIVRGAASLQYGTQFGGLLNFVMKKAPENKKIELTARQSAGSFGFYNAFTSIGGTSGKLSYYGFVQYKTARGWRPNSELNTVNTFFDIDYQFNEKTKAGIDFTHMNYLAHQGGGLTDAMFQDDPRQSNRERNWFQVNWNMLAVHFDHQINEKNDINVRVFSLLANRYSLGFRPNRVATVDDQSERDLIKGDFVNWGAEARYLKRYYTGKMLSVLLGGTRYYHGYNHSVQGSGSKGSGPDFSFIDDERFIIHDYRFPNRNTSVFLENIFYLNEKLSITPGLRYEYIFTTADGFYSTISKDLAGNIINITKTDERRINERQFALGGLGLSYKVTSETDIYANVSQNYRSITFSDMRISNPSSVIDPNMKDERGHSIDLGIRSNQTKGYNFDLSTFYLNYNNRIGEVQFYDESNRVLRKRGNIGQAVIMGVESYAEGDLVKLGSNVKENRSAIIFVNFAFITSTYKASEIPGVKGRKVEFVPTTNLKTGTRLGYGPVKGSFQLTHLGKQFTDATNAIDGGVTGVVGLIPAYTIMDISVSYDFKKYFRLEGSVNNLANQMYFTRRATGYPGPGILPSDGRGFYLTLQAKF